MAELTLQTVGNLLEKVLDDRLAPINTKLEAISETLSSHTQTLDFLVKQT